MFSAYLFWVAFSTIFVAELVGDKLFYGIGALTVSFPPASVACGMVPAFVGKMLAAVLLGGLLSRIPAPIVTTMSAITFLATALALSRTGRRPIVPSSHVPAIRGGALQGATVTFATLFFSEWADYGQLTAASLAALYHAPGIVWAGGTAALIAKGLFAMLCGIGVRRWLPQRAMRYAAVGTYVAIGVVTALRVR